MGRQDSRFYPAAFPLKLDLQYRLVSAGRRVPLSGSGQTLTFGSREVVFTGDQSIPNHARVQLAVFWPVLLDGRIRLQLVIEGCVTSAALGVFTVRIGTYHFRTRGSAAVTAEPSAGAMAAVRAMPRTVSLAVHA